MFSMGIYAFMCDLLRSMGSALGPSEGLFWRFGGSWQGSWRLGSMCDEFRAPGYIQMGLCWAQVGAFLRSSW